MPSSPDIDRTQGGGSAVVYNSSLVTANPVNKVVSQPQNLVQVAAKAMSKVGQIWGGMGSWGLRDHWGGCKLQVVSEAVSKVRA